MAVKQLMDYLENGNIKNSVNYPSCDGGTCIDAGRLTINHKKYSEYDFSVYKKVLGDAG